MNELARFENYIAYEPNTGCWLWTACLSSRGYGEFRADGKCQLAYRWFYMRQHGKLASGIDLHHRCQTPSCVNPAHLVPMAHAEHSRLLDSKSITAALARKTHCAHGHPFDAKNTYRTPRGHRTCRKCLAARMHDYQMRKNHTGILRGQFHPQSKLQFWETDLVAELYATGLFSQRDIARAFGVTQTLVKNVLKNCRPRLEGIAA